MMHSVPVYPTINQEELQQTTAILLYCSHHINCLYNLICDTGLQSCIQLKDVMSYTASSCCTITRNYLSAVNITTLTNEQIVEILEPFIGSYPMPPSLIENRNLANSSYSWGMLLEKMVSDWICLRDALQAHPFNQVQQLMNQVIDTLRTIYNENAEYKFVKELLDFCNGQPLTAKFKCYFQALILAAQLQTTCIGFGCFELIVSTPYTHPLFLFKLLLAEIPTLFSTNPEFSTALQKKVHSIYDAFMADLNLTFCDVRQVIHNPELLLKATRRIFYAIQSLLSTMYPHYAAILQQGLQMVEHSFPATAENHQKCTPSAPQNILDVYSLHDMIGMEIQMFYGVPTAFMKKRWGQALYQLLQYLQRVGQKDSTLYTDIHSLCIQVLGL